MNLKACFWTGTEPEDARAVIYKEDGAVVFEAFAGTPQEAEIRCMQNRETRQLLLEKLNTLKINLTWVATSDVDLVFPEAQEEPETGAGEQSEAEVEQEAAEAPATAESGDTVMVEVPLNLTPDEFKEQVGRLIIDLEKNEIETENEKVRHRNEIKRLDSDQQAIKDKLYEARRGAFKTHVAAKVVMDYGNSMVRIVREDTGEIVEEREMTMAEKQISAIPEDVPAAAEAPKVSSEDLIPLKIQPDTDRIFELYDGFEWAVGDPTAIKKDTLFRIYDAQENIVDINGAEEFLAVKKARVAKKSGVISIDCKAVAHAENDAG